MGDHRYQQAHRPVGRGAQDRAQLRGEHLGARQAVADGALAQRGVGGHRGLAVQRLVRADVQRADGDGTARHHLHHRGIGFVLFFLARQVRAAHEEELAAEQADAVRAGRQRQRGLLGQFDIGVQHHVDAVQRDRGHVAQQAQLGALVGVGGLAAAVFLQDARRGFTTTAPEAPSMISVSPSRTSSRTLPRPPPPARPCCGPRWRYGTWGRPGR